MRAGRLTLLAILVALWVVAAYQSRHIDSDRPTSMTSVTSTLGEEVEVTEPQARTSPAVGPGAAGVDRESASAARASRSHRPAPRLNRGVLTDTTCYVWTGNRTASGAWPKVGDAASNRYPFGTRLYVQNIGTVVVRDRIGHGSSLDLFFADRASCLRFGRQHLRVQVVS